MKKPIAIVFNDVHIQVGNEDAVLRAVDFMFDYAKKNKIKHLIFAGDMFERRSFLRLSEMKTLQRIFDSAEVNGLYIDAIPGNHSKTRYESFDSYLDIFNHYPNVSIHRTITNKVINGVNFTFLPFFSDDKLVPMIEEAEGGDILISHFEMKGSVNLGMVSEKNTITKRMLKKWKKVYLGHFHDNHDISENIAHLPALRQNNFGEDTNKGFSVVYEDLSYSIIKGDFKAFVKIELDIDSMTLDDIKKLIKTHKNSTDTIRFEFSGEEDKLKALDKKMFEGTGIDVKKKYKAVVIDTTQPEPKPIKKYDKKQVLTTFEKFCEEKDLNYKKGITYLTKFLEEKET